MNRLDYCKQELKKKASEEKSAKIIFQELNNMLPTYREKKELADYLTSLTGKGNTQ